MNAVHDLNAIADAVRAKNPNVLTSKTAAAALVKDVFATVLEAIQNGDEVHIHAFGKFIISERGERTGRNPQTGQSIQIAASKSLKFKASKSTKKGVLA